jgi:hypothetical protein
VDVRDRLVIDEGNLHFIEFVEHGGIRSGLEENQGQGIRGSLKQAFHVEGKR